jgi:hypothetical protein
MYKRGTLLAVEAICWVLVATGLETPSVTVVETADVVHCQVTDPVCGEFTEE